MTTHGGTRTGAGRPQGGISQARRLITDAIQSGLAQAGRKKYPDRVHPTDLESAAVQTGAMIVDDMIQAGQGNDVMKLWAAVSMKENESDKGNTKNTLYQALSSLPAAGHVSDVSQIGTNRLEAPEPEGGTTHTERDAPHNQPFFAPQNCLELSEPDDDSGTHFRDHERAQAS